MPADSIALIRSFWRDFLRPYRRRFLGVGALVVLSILLQLPMPLLTMRIIDTAIETSRPDRITQLALMLAALILARHVFSFLNESFTLRLKESIILDVEAFLVRHIQSLPLGFFSGRHSTYLQSRVMTDSRAIEGALVRTVVTVLMDGLTFVVGAVVVLVIRFELGLVLLATLAPFALIRFYANRRMRELSRTLQERQAQASAVVSESFAGIRALKALGQEGSRQEVILGSLRALHQIYVRTNWFGILSTLGTSLVTSLTIAFVLWFGMRNVIAGVMTPGEVVGILSFLSFLYNPVSSFVAANLSIQSAASAIQRIYEFLVLQPEPADGRALDVDQVKGAIDFRKVSFAYTPGQPVLNDLELSIRAGETVAIVGRSGAGKSTLVNLLLRFYTADAGEILLDGHDVRGLSLASLRRAIGIVDQQTFLWSGTILDNIRSGRPEASREEVVAAAKQAYAHGFIETLAAAYDTEVGERGVRLSGGQCQRIALARMFLRDPAVLILDEAISAVDSESESFIQEALSELTAGRTTILIAHRLSSLFLADRAVLIEDGAVIEDGGHEELMARNGAYARLFRQQFQQQSQQQVPELSFTNLSHPFPSHHIAEVVR